ncbi:MAG: hypothetical protein LBH41_02375 [Rickettsiales bacterium]|jgi:hypothetical protein|nr:hypothetical protein [Rickettsiales bacterium]
MLKEHIAQKETFATTGEKLRKNPAYTRKDAIWDLSPEDTERLVNGQNLTEEEEKMASHYRKIIKGNVHFRSHGSMR